MTIIVPQGTYATAAALALCVRNKLHIDRAAQGYTTSSFSIGGTTLAVNDGTMFAAGTVIDFPEDGTQSVYFVRSVSSNNLTVQVHMGSTDAAHASGATVRISPRFTSQEVTDAISHATDMLWSEVYDVATTTITYSSTAVYFAAPTDFESPISATQKGTETTNISYTEYNLGWGRPHLGGPLIRVIRGLPVADFASRVALYIPAWSNTTNDILLTYVRQVTPTTVSTGLMADTVCWGACDHLLSGALIHRSSPAYSANPPIASGVDTLRSSLNAADKFKAGKRRLQAELQTTYPRPPSWR